MRPLEKTWRAVLWPPFLYPSSTLLFLCAFTLVSSEEDMKKAKRVEREEVPASPVRRPTTAPATAPPRSRARALYPPTAVIIDSPTVSPTPIHHLPCPSSILFLSRCCRCVDVGVGVGVWCWC